MNFSFDKEIILENTFLLVRPISENDIDNLVTVATKDKDLLQFSPTPIYTKELLKKYIDKAVDNRRNKNRYTFIVFDKIKNAFAGSTSFLNISNADDRLEIGATWYENLGAVRVEFRTDERNLASRKAIEKIGAQFEGILRRHTLLYDGFRRNTVCYSILKSEWSDLKNQPPNNNSVQQIKK